MASNLSQFVKHGRKIIGVGMNYRSLASVLNKLEPTEPVIYTKPVSTYITKGQKIKLADDWKEVLYEVELGVIIGEKGYKIPEPKAMDHVGGYCVALDMTSLGILKTLSQPDGLPWDIHKGFDTSCPVGDFIPKEQIKDPHNIELWCKVNGELKQQEKTSDMIFTVPSLISYVTRFMTLEPGDLIITGTPSGLGPVKSGDCIECGITDVDDMQFEVE